MRSDCGKTTEAGSASIRGRRGSGQPSLKRRQVIAVGNESQRRTRSLREIHVPSSTRCDVELQGSRLKVFLLERESHKPGGPTAQAFGYLSGHFGTTQQLWVTPRRTLNFGRRGESMTTNTGDAERLIRLTHLHSQLEQHL